MVARTLPNLGLKAFFDVGEDGWDDEMSLNLLTLSVLTQGTVLSKVAATPGSPTDGDVHILDETHATEPNKIAIRDAGAWVYVAPTEGWLVYNRAMNYYERFNGTVWAELATGGGGGGGALDDLSDVDTTTVAPTDGQGLVYDSADSTWKPGTIAGGGGGGGEPSIFDKILHARGTALDTTYTNGDKVDKLIVSGDMRALVYDRYTNSGTAVNATNATVTVPAGKIAVLLYYEAGDQVLNSASFYRHRLRNITAGTETNPFGNNNISPAGIVSPDGANMALHYPMRVGVAGDVLVMQAWSSGDSNYRTVAGSCVIAFADATTGDWALPAGGGGGAVAPIGYSASHTLVLGDAEGYLRFTNSSAATVTVPPEASVAFPIGTVIYLESAGTGALDIAAGSGVTVNSRGAALTMAGQYAAAQLKKVASDTWTVLGDVS